MKAYERGDYAAALRVFRQLADQGYANAQSNLGVMYSNGYGVPQDYGEAVKWYRKAADQGNASGQFGLGVMYNFGLGVPQDIIQAYMWFNLAAAQGEDGAKRLRDNLAKMMTVDQIAQAQKLAREWKPTKSPK